MMSEKRFTKDYVNGLIYITDNLSDKGYCIICEGIGGDIDNIVDKLNKQQATIDKQDKEIEYWKENAMTLLLQVRRLLPRMTDKEIAEYSKELEKIQDER